MADTEVLFPEPQNPAFPAVYQLALKDKVRGGPGGTANRQAGELLERDAWLEANKVDKEAGSRLMTAAEISKLSGIETEATKNTTVATANESGLMSAADKTKLEGIAANATANAASATTPKQNGTAVAGSESGFSRGDHVHPNTCATQAVTDNSVKQANTAYVHNFHFDNRIIGEPILLPYQPAAAQMIKWRRLPATGLCYLIADYPDLFNQMYCGDANNQTALFWFRCNDPNNPKGSRSTAGPYFRVADWRGVFMRGGRGEQRIQVRRRHAL